jgi:hypothetical protein
MANEPIVQTYPPDFTQRDIDLVSGFKTNGAPGLAGVGEEKLEQIAKMYLSGLSFDAISTRLRVKKAIVLYVVERQRLYETRQETLNALIESVPKRLEIFSTQNTDFFLELAAVIRSYYVDKIELYKRTNDSTVLETMDTKLMKIYEKCSEILLGIEPKAKEAGSLNMVTSPGTNVFISTPNDEQKNKLSEVLKMVADLNRAKESDKEKK